MNNNHPNEQDPLICHCSGTTKAKIKALIANEANTLEKIANATGATTGCGACDYLVMELLVQDERKNRSL
ncbi:MAG: (2Fe-2S)-binding protein [Methylococcales bacterium]|nr:(2Fe-2S)-binding protein [Methylococcales bacterium]